MGVAGCRARGHVSPCVCILNTLAGCHTQQFPGFVTKSIELVGVHVTFEELVMTKANFKVAVALNWAAPQIID